MFTSYHPTQDDKNASACYDMLDNSPIDAVIAKFGLQQTLRSLAQSLAFHAEDNDEPLLQTDEGKDLARRAVAALDSLA